MGNVGEQVVTIAVAITGIAILAVLVSKNSQTPQVITAAGNSFTSALVAAVSPITGGSNGGFTSFNNISGNSNY